MRISKIIIFLLCLASIGQAQNIDLSGSIRGNDNSAVPYATLMLKYQADSSLAKVDMSDANGNYKLVGLSAGDYFLEVQSIGYQNSNTAVPNLTASMRLPLIVLQAASQNLDEVTVQASKALVEVKADRTVFNVSSSLSATGTNGQELLRKAPGVMLDNNNNVILEGKSGVIFYVDDKPLQLAGEDLQNYLRNLQAEQIESVELITQPSSKYEAAGTAGIINIKLKKDMRFGTNGTVASSYTYGKYGRWNNSLNLNHRKRKFNSFLNYSSNLAETYNFFEMTREQSGLEIDQSTNTIGDGFSQNLRTGLDYYASKNSILGLVINGSLNNETNTSDGYSTIRSQQGNAVDQILRSANIDDVSTKNLFVNANYRYSDSTDHKFGLDLDYGYYEGRRTTFQPNYYYSTEPQTLLSEVIYRMRAPLDINILSAKADYEFTMWNAAFALGSKISQVNTQNSFLFFNVQNGADDFNNDRSNDFNYDERVTAAYVNYSQEFEKFGLQLGLRAEHTLSEGLLQYRNSQSDSLVKRSYLNWFPSGGLTYQLNKTNSLALTYSRRILRPDYQALNPFLYVLNELSFRKGNPFLQPQYINNLKLSHTFNYSLTTSISYSYINDFFAQVTDTLDERRGFITPLNVADQRIISLNVSYPFKLAKWWEVYVNVNAYHSAYIANNPAFTPLEQTTLSIYGQNTFSLPREWKFQLSGWFNTPSIWGGTFRTKSMGSLDLSLQKRFFNNSLSLRLAFNDVLFTSFWRADSEFNGLQMTGRGGRDSRQIALSLSYNFGNNKIKRINEHKGGLDQESERLN